MGQSTSYGDTPFLPSLPPLPHPLHTYSLPLRAAYSRWQSCFASSTPPSELAPRTTPALYDQTFSRNAITTNALLRHPIIYRRTGAWEDRCFNSLLNLPPLHPPPPPSVRRHDTSTVFTGLATDKHPPVCVSRCARSCWLWCLATRHRHPSWGRSVHCEATPNTLWVYFPIICLYWAVLAPPYHSTAANKQRIKKATVHPSCLRVIVGMWVLVSDNKSVSTSYFFFWKSTRQRIEPQWWEPHPTRSSYSQG